MSAERPPSTTVLTDGKFELRDYPPLTLAEVTVEGGQWGAANRGFRILAGYIFGGNARGQKIEMTAPVTQQRTDPTAARDDGEHWIVRFIMPPGFTPQSLPAPEDSRIHLFEAPPTRVALIRFSGWALSFIVRGETQKLERWIATRRYQQTGPAALAQYDPPWTIWFLRHNEIQAPIAR